LVTPNLKQHSQLSLSTLTKRLSQDPSDPST